MRLYTSFWSNPELQNLDATIISISRGEPRWLLAFRYKRLRALAPNDRTWAQKDRETFTESYLDQLREIGADAILGDLRRVGAVRPTIMLCYEKLADPDEFCHRRVLADYIERETGIVVPELQAGALPQREDAPEMRLFNELPKGEKG